jgi:two-component system OmpR family response regulator
MSTDAAAGSQPRILVVDDEEHITELLAMGLGYQGFEVERASPGRQALDAVARGSGPDRARRDAPRPRRVRGGAAPAA